MTRASDLRDAIASELKERLESFDADRIDTFLIPDYEKDELQAPRIGVRVGRREVEVDQGPDNRQVTIEIGVIGLTEEVDPALPGTKASMRAQAVAASDRLDEIIEDILSVWTPCGPLSRGVIAEHSFVSIGQPYAFDPKQLYQNGVWVSIVEVTYRDCKDN